MNPALMQALSKIDFNFIIKAGIIILALIFGLVLYNKLVYKTRNKKIINDLEEDVEVNKLSYPLSYYGIWAADIYNAVEGMGTNEQAIFDVFKKMKNKDDVLQLMTAFGVKEGETLSQWVIGDLGDDDKATINRLLSDKNINYQF
jgi:hypothetical protein